MLSLTGDITLQDHMRKFTRTSSLGNPTTPRMVVTSWKGMCFPTVELVLLESPKYLERRFDPETGLALIDVEAA